MRWINPRYRVQAGQQPRLRPRPDWLSPKNGLLLEFLETHDLVLPAKPLSRNRNRHGHEIGYSTVRQRLRELEAHGVIETVDDAGYYAATDKGRAYLAGDLESDNLEQDE